MRFYGLPIGKTGSAEASSWAGSHDLPTLADEVAPLASGLCHRIRKCQKRLRKQTNATLGHKLTGCLADALRKIVMQRHSTQSPEISSEALEKYAIELSPNLGDGR